MEKVKVHAKSTNTLFELPGAAPVEIPGSDIGFYGPDVRKYSAGRDISAYDETTRKLAVEELQQ